MFEPIYYEDLNPENIEIASIDKRTYSEGNITFHSISLKYVSGTMERKFFLMGLPVFTCLGIKKFEKETQNEGGKYSLAAKFESSNPEHRKFAEKWLSIMQRIEHLIKAAYDSGKDQNVLTKLVSKVKQQGGTTTLLVKIKDPIKLFYNQNEETDDYDIGKIDDKTLYFKLDKNFKASVIYKDEKDQPKDIYIKNIERLKNVSFTASLIISFNWIYIGSTKITSLVTNVKHAYIYEITESFTIPSFVKENANRLNIMSEEELQRVIPEKVEKLSLEEDNEERVTVEKIKTLEKDGRRTNEERKPEEKSKDYEEERSEERKNRERRSDEKGSKEKSKRSEEESRKNIQVITNMDDIIPTENDENEE
jgi:hypothetical protein